MILNVGLRTDIVHHYHEWLFRRFEEGYVYARNPLFPGRVNTYLLAPDKIDAVVFCSKNYEHVLGRLPSLVSKFRTYFFYTVTGYGSDLEPAIPPAEESIRHLKELSRIVGKDRLVWRYDPVLLTKRHTAEHHFDTFESLASRISPYVSRCVFSFVEMFIKISQRIPDIVPLTRESKRTLAMGLAKIAQKHHLPLQICCSEADYGEFGIKREGCVTLEALGAANDCSFRHLPHKGNKAGCLCFESRDIGWYDSCPSECKYCNANRGIESVKENVMKHDPSSPLLIGGVRENDVILNGVQNSLLMHEGRQISLFDL